MAEEQKIDGGIELWHNNTTKGVDDYAADYSITDLKNTSQISRMCKKSNEPIYITKNGYGDMVIMSMKLYEEKMFMLDVYNKLVVAEEQIAEGKTLDRDSSIKSIREKYNV